MLLMAMFGWQGATCIDEWTMAACNLAMGATLLFRGSGAYSIDNVLIHRNPALAEKPWFRWMTGSLPLPSPRPWTAYHRQKDGAGCRTEASSRLLIPWSDHPIGSVWLGSLKRFTRSGRRRDRARAGLNEA
jgi:hypothetical protein